MKFKHFLELAEEDPMLFSLNSMALSETLDISETQAKYFMAKLEWESEKHGCYCEECMCGQDLDEDLPLEYQSEAHAQAIQDYFDSQRLKQDLNTTDKVKRDNGIDVIIDDGGTATILNKGLDYDIDKQSKKFNVEASIENHKNTSVLNKVQMELDLAIDDVLKSNRFSAKVKDKVANAISAEEVRDIIINSEKKKNKARG